MEEEITTADAEEWIDPETFIYKGEVYIVTHDCKVVLKKEAENGR